MDNIKIEIIKITTTVISALVSALVIGAIWWNSVNYKFESINTNIDNTERQIEILGKRADVLTIEFRTIERNTAVDKQILINIASRLDRIDSKLDNIADSRNK